MDLFLFKKLQHSYNQIIPLTMKYFIFCTIVLFTGPIAFSQTDTTAPYLKTRQIPDFKLRSVNYEVFTQSILDKDKSTVIMLFNPECDHCQQQLDLLLSMPLVTTNAQIILSSIENTAKNRIFYNKNHLEKYPFVHLGQDYEFFFGGYYKPNTIPVLAFYNKQRQLTLFNQGNAKKNQIEQALKQ